MYCIIYIALYKMKVRSFPSTKFRPLAQLYMRAIHFFANHSFVKETKMVLSQENPSMVQKWTSGCDLCAAATVIAIAIAVL